MNLLRALVWLAVATLGVFALSAISWARGEQVSAAWLVIAAACAYVLAYRFYSRFLALKVLRLDARNTTPAVRHDDGHDYVPTNRWVVFGHHFAAIAGPGPLIGPILAAQFGYLPGTLWIVIGCVLGGAVQDFVVLVLSLRRDGRSLVRLASDALGPVGGLAATLAVLLIMIILIAVLGLVVVNALAESPWGVFTVAATVPIALAMGMIMRGQHGRSVVIATALGLVLLAAALVGGHWVAASPTLGPAFTLGKPALAWAVIAYGLAASVLPVWLLLAPRDYLSTFVKLGTVLALAAGILVVRPELHLPAFTQFGDGSGPLFGGKIFPFCFITIACGAISGFHSLVSSGTTPRLLARETDARMVGYGSMLLESLVAIMAMVAAASLPAGEYFAINTPVTATRDAAQTLEWITQQGYPVTAEQMQRMAELVGEKTVQGRAGGAPCLAVGMAQIFQRWIGDESVTALWYHFALMFEALFILTTLDAGTRVGRYLLQDALARVVPALGGRGYAANLATSGLFVALWGYFLYAGVRDKQGGVNVLWPLFGIANQLLAGTALIVVTTLLMRSGRTRWTWITLVPLAFVLTVTVTAAWQKIFSADPKVGFLVQAEKAASATDAFNLRLDAVLAGAFLVLVGTVLVSAVREWWRILSGHAPVDGDGIAVAGRAPGGPPLRCC